MNPPLYHLTNYVLDNYKRKNAESAKTTWLSFTWFNSKEKEKGKEEKPNSAISTYHSWFTNVDELEEKLIKAIMQEPKEQIKSTLDL